MQYHAGTSQCIFRKFSWRIFRILDLMNMFIWNPYLWFPNDDSRNIYDFFLVDKTFPRDLLVVRRVAYGYFLAQGNCISCGWYFWKTCFNGCVGVFLNPLRISGSCLYYLCHGHETIVKGALQDTVYANIIAAWGIHESGLHTNAWIFEFWY